MIVAADYPFMEIFWTMTIFFVWVAWMWLLVVILSDVFRRDVSGWTKAGWTLFVLVLPLLGVFVYLIAHGRDMNDRRQRETEIVMSRGHQLYVAEPTRPPDGSASQIAEAKRLLDTGVIDSSEFARLKAQVLR
jgi:hypothetical protein